MEKTAAHKASASSEAPDNAIQRGVDATGAALHSGIENVAEPARHALERVSGAAHETVDKLANSASHTVERFSSQTRLVTEAPGLALDYSKSWIQQRPLEAVGAALALGFVLGRLTAR